jgi:cytochrome-b5 reductase
MSSCIELIALSTEIKKVLKPDVFQEFPLQEKTVISHNVAM